MSKLRSPWFELALLVDAVVLLISAWALAGRALGTRTDHAEQRWIRDLEPARSSVVAHAGRVVAVVGSASVLAPVAAALAIVLVARGRPRCAGFVALSTLGGLELAPLVKDVVQRPRPPRTLRLIDAGQTSYPSGHATQSMAILLAFAVTCVAVGMPRRIAIAAGVAGSLVIGVSRVVVGVHYPSDVLAGWLLGLAWVGTCAVALRPTAET